MPVNKRSVARGTGDRVVNKLGKALADVGLAANYKKEVLGLAFKESTRMPTLNNKLGKILADDGLAANHKKRGFRLGI